MKIDYEIRLLNKSNRWMAESASPPTDKEDVMRKISFMIDRACERTDIKNILIKLGLGQTGSSLDDLFEEERELRRFTSELLEELGIEIESIESVNFDINIPKSGTPMLDIWYKNPDGEIIGIVLEHRGTWQVHIHDGQVISDV